MYIGFRCHHDVKKLTVSRGLVATAAELDLSKQSNEQMPIYHACILARSHAPGGHAAAGETSSLEPGDVSVCGDTAVNRGVIASASIR